MSTPWEKIIDGMKQRKKEIAEEGQKIDEALEAYAAFRQKMEALSPEACKVFASEQVRADEGTQIEKKDLAGKPALECARIILAERNSPVHFSVIAKEALRRGYIGRMSGSKEEIESRTVQSFWAALSRSDDMESVGRGLYQLRGSSSSNGLPAESPPKPDLFDARSLASVRVNRQSWAGWCAQLLIDNGPLLLGELVDKLQRMGKGANVKNFTVVVNSALWRRKDLFEKRDKRYYLRTANIEFED
jgi:hypothetical protein